MNDIGLTYGGTYPNVDILPDLLSVTNEDGVSGYIYIKEIFNKMPNNPQEAAEIGYEFTCTVPIYDVDGKTVLGEFHFGDPE